ncbi:MAG: hypothetical protein J7500_03400 [Sphingomonas sp.]|uniref:hypothetical protein n=1 Tax=Sphingomonas sp. TaxID=28214 RepID=UPI001B0696CA|nr:hypothetical protein [Sphingomonas sp.]MBO9621737.1 hypothetical protein [Sphingomonas sp.]
MPEGSTGPLSSEAPLVAAPQETIVVDRPERPTPFPPFPVSAAERGVETLSRFAGPVAFFLALGGIVWLIAK